MVNPNNSKALKSFVKSKIIDNPIYPINQNNLIDKIVNAIEKEQVISVKGSAGTGRDYLVNDVFISQLKKKYEIQKINIHSNVSISEDFAESLSIDDNRFLIVYNDLLIPTSVAFDNNGTIDKIREILGKGFEISLPNLREQFLNYPKIIESFTKEIYNKSIDQIMVGIVGYLETLISGLPNNFEDLKSIIESEKRPLLLEESYKNNRQFGIILTYNSYLDLQSDRKKIWNSFWKGPNTIELNKIVAFNESFAKYRGGTIAQQYLGASRKHPKSIALERIKIYVRQFLNNQNIQKINEHIFDPLNWVVKRIESGEYSSNSRIESVILFKQKTRFKQYDDFQTIILDGDTYHLTDPQAIALKFICEKYSHGGEFRGSNAMENIFTDYSSLQPLFKGNSEFYRKFFILINKRAGIYRINPDYCPASYK